MGGKKISKNNIWNKTDFRLYAMGEKQNYSSGKIYPEPHDLELAADYQRICGMR